MSCDAIFSMKKQDKWCNWENEFLDRGISPELVQYYKPYVENLLSAGVPVIFEFEHLAKLLGFNLSYLASAINATNVQYRRFEIPKRRGGKREIAAPYPALLSCQRWINQNILSHVPVHNSAHGFVSGRSIVTNAQQHIGSTCVLNLDLTDFFHSINLNQVMQTFLQIGYMNNVAFYLASLCTLDNHLPQGAATSPALSNIIARHFDNRISNLSASYNLKYTRYADDMTCSGENIPQSFIQIVNDISVECGFMLNHNKTKLYQGPKRKIVTGLVLGDNGLTLPRYKNVN